MNDQQNQYNSTNMVNTGKRTAALVLGVISLVFASIGFVTIVLSFFGFFTLPMSIIAVVLAIKSDKEGVKATGGLVTGVIALIFSGISVACWIACIAFMGLEGWEDFYSFSTLL